MFIDDSFNTGSTINGVYTVVADLLDDQGAVLASDETNFSIVSDANVTATVRVITDRNTYHTSDSIEIGSLVQNLSSNTLINDAILEVNAFDPNGALVFETSQVYQSLTPNFSNNAIDLYQLQDSPIGQYSIVSRLLTADGQVLASDETTVTVENNITQSLQGRVIVDSANAYLGDSFNCTFNSSSELQSQLLTVSLLQGESSSSELEIDTQAAGVGNFACVLQADVNGVWEAIDFETFSLSEITISAEVGDKGRVLILLDDSMQCTDEPFGPRNTPSLVEQQAFLETLLDDAGWSYTITLNSTDFTRELRTGGYSNYMLMSELSDLPHFVQKEVREAVYRGEGLIEAGKRLQPYNVIHEAQGIRHRGQERRATGLSLSESELSVADNVTFSHIDSNVRIATTSATTVAEYNGGQAEQSSHHHGRHFHGFRFFKHHHPYWCPPVKRTSPAVTVNEFGLGKTVFMGFDVLLEATSMGSEESLYTELLLNSLAAVNPEPPLLTIGTDYPLVFTITNVGSATPATFVLPIPDSVSVVDAGEGVIDETTQSISWTLDLVDGDAIDIPLWVEMPELATTLTGAVVTGEGANGIERATASIDLVPEAAINIDDVIESAKQARALRKVKHSLSYARWYLSKGRVDHALRSLLTATSHVSHIQKRYESENLTALRVNIDLLIKQVAKQAVVAEPRHRCVVRGGWGGYHYPRTPKRCGHKPRGWGHHGGGNGYYGFKQLENDLGSEQ